MNFRPKKARPEPEINLIPFIDVLLVVLIFLMLTTSYDKFSELRVELPRADASSARERALEIKIGISKDGRYSVDGQPTDAAGLGSAVEAAARKASSEATAVLAADANAAHQLVIRAMEAARGAGLSRIAFATRADGAPR